VCRLAVNLAARNLIRLEYRRRLQGTNQLLPVPIWSARPLPPTPAELGIIYAMMANAEHESGVLGSHPQHMIERFGNHVIHVVELLRRDHIRRKNVYNVTQRTQEDAFADIKIV
jgi:hypothetical protein